MLKIDQVRMYPIVTRHISVPTNEDQKYNIIFMSENSDFITAYPSLKIKPHFVKRITAVPFKMPKLLATTGTLIPYKKALGLVPTMDPKQYNAYIDVSPFLSKIDEMYGPGTYRRSMILSKIISYLSSCKQVGENRKNVLIYHIDVSKDKPETIFKTRAFILLMIAKIGEGKFPFDKVLLAVETGGSVKYTSIYSQDQKPLGVGRLLSIFKKLIGIKDEVDDEDSITAQEGVLNLANGYQLINDSLIG